MLRLVHGESPDPSAYELFRAFLTALATFDESQHDAIECAAALRILAQLGLDAGTIPGDEAEPFTEASLAAITEDRTAYIARVNRGIAASGL
jgi:hypothetical protein